MKIYYLNVSKRTNDGEFNTTLNVFSTKKKAKKYFDDLCASYDGSVMEIEQSTNRHYVKTQTMVMYWYIEEGHMDKKWDGKPVEAKREWL